MNDNDDDLKALLHETAAGITPHGSYEEIRTRISGPGPRRWVLPTLAAAAATVLVVGGIGLALSHDRASTAPTNLDRTTTTAAPVTKDLPMYFANADSTHPNLFIEMRKTTYTDNPVFAATKALLAPAQPSDPDYRNIWTTIGAELTGAGLSTAPGSNRAESIQLTFSHGFPERRPGMTDNEARLGLEQLFLTARASTGSATALSDPVDFVVVVKDQRVDSLLGIPLAEVVNANADALMAPVQITSLTNGQTVPAGPLKVEGLAATFEANVVWEVRLGGDAVVMNGHATARECCTLSPYSFTVDLQPGTYTIVAHDTDESGAGGPVNQDSKEITVE